jgi:hypothetical protein
MVYYVVCDGGQENLVLDTFVSKSAAEQFIQTMQVWFALPLQIRDLLDANSILIDKNT